MNKLESPSLLAILREGLSGLEFARLMAASPALALQTRGSGEPVIVLPGLGASNTSTIPLRGYLTWLGQGLMDEGPGKEGIERNQAEPFLAPEMFYLSGYGGHRVYIDRDNDLIVVRLGPFSGMQPLKPHWDNAFLLNTIIRGIR